LFKYTFLYRNFFVPSKIFSKKNKIWIEFIETVENSKNKTITDVAYEYSAKMMKDRDMYDRLWYTGKPCFTYSIKEDRVHLHFNNNEGPVPGPLSTSRIEARRKELVDIFKAINNDLPEVTVVEGYSWLYNLEAYRRLFPSEYVKSGKVIKDDFRSMDIWGQFIDSSYNIKTEFTANFVARLNKAATIRELKNIFEFYPVRVEAPISVFFEYFHI
jgi:hypothetical protein